MIYVSLQMKLAQRDEVTYQDCPNSKRQSGTQNQVLWLYRLATL